jgi:hypothetical protein
MSNQEQFAQWRKKVDEANQTAGEVLAYDRERRCWRVMPKAEANRKGLLNAGPEDLKVGSLAEDARDNS